MNPAAQSSQAIDPTSTIAENKILRGLLMETALQLSSFRWRLKAAGYPFREPPGLNCLQIKLDQTLHPEQFKPPRDKAQQQQQQQHPAVA